MDNMQTFKGKTVLVVDDEPELREILKDELELHDFTVLEAENGALALEIVSREKVDLVISDIRMPGGNGTELLKNMNAKNERIPVLLFMTGFSDLHTDEAYDMGAAGILAKPFDMDLLFSHLERLLLPIPERWNRKTERVEVSLSIELKMEGVKEGLLAKVINIGTGGMFISVSQNFPVMGKTIDFKLHLQKPKAFTIEGTGMVRWVRHQDANGMKQGFGLEFKDLSPEGSKEIYDYIQSCHPKAFIPKQ